MPPPPAGNGPCVTASFVTGSVRVLSLGQPLLLMDSVSIAAPTGTPSRLWLTAAPPMAPASAAPSPAASQTLGAGAMGCLWAARLAQHGAMVTLLLRDECDLRRHTETGGQITLEDSGVLQRIPVQAQLATSVSTPIQLLLVTTKAQDVDTARAAQSRAEAGVVAAQADIEVAKADLAMTQTDITKSRILSPVDGIVLKRDAEPGQTVASSFQAPVLFILAEDLMHMQLEADVDEADIGAVKEGQKASFRVDAYPGKSFPAVIDTIEYSPKVTENVVTYKAVLTVDNNALLLRPGMTATAQIVVQEVPDALAVPNAALRYAPPKEQKSQSFSVMNLFIPRMPPATKNSAPGADGMRTLYVLDNGAPKAISVHAGVTDGKDTEILSGEVKAGEQVIISSKAAGS